MDYQLEERTFPGAEWICLKEDGTKNFYCKSFLCAHPVTRAALFVCAETPCELYVNGVRVNDDLFFVGAYRSETEFREYDVTNLIAKGENTVGFLTGVGRLPQDAGTGKCRLLIQMVLTFDNGETATVNTDGTWKCTRSPFIKNGSVFFERCDAHTNIPSRCTEPYDGLARASVVCEKPSCFFIRRVAPPIRVMRTLEAVSVSAQSNIFAYDFGETVIGQYALTLTHTHAGQEIRAVCSLHPDGDMKACDPIICTGLGSERYEPHLGLNRFRYLLISGVSDPSHARPSAYVYHNALARTGTLQSTYRFLRDLFRMTEQALDARCFDGFYDFETNSFPANDTQLFAVTACFLADCSSLLARWTDRGIKTDQGGYGADDETYLVPWILYRFYGDHGILEARFDAIIDLVRRRCDGVRDFLPANVPNAPSPGDPDLPQDFFAHAYYCYMLKIVTQICEALGKFALAEEFAQKLENARYAFRRRYFLPLENDFTPHTQGALVLPLAFDLLPSHRRKAVAKTLRDRLYEDGRATTGKAGTRYLMNVLCENGQSEAAFFLLERERSLSRGGATQKTHLSCATGWAFECLAGIRVRESEPGFAHLVLSPVILPELGSFQADFHAVAGVVHVEWSVSGNTVTYAFSTPQSVTLIQPDGVIRSFPPGSHKAIWRHGAE